MISLPILLASISCTMAVKLTPVHEWNSLDYQWNNESEKEHAIATGLYDKTKVILYDVEWHQGRLFVTTPRTHDANPASLSTVSEDGLLDPYPSPERHVVGNCSGITNALRVVVDKCDNMWIVDSGTIGNEVICPAQILKIELDTDRLVMQHTISEEVSKGGLLSTSAVRTKGDKCEDIMLFAADLRGSGYVLFDGTSSWRLDSDYFEPDANLSSFSVDDWTVDITYGPIGFLVIDKQFAGTEMGIMWSFDGRHVYGLPMQELINSRDSQKNLSWYKSKYELPSALTAALISKKGIMFGSYVGPHKLECVWLGNPVEAEYVESPIIETDPSPLITSMKTTFDDDGNEYFLLAVNDYLRLRAGKADFDKVTSGIYIVKIADLTNGTLCEPRADFVPAKSWEEKGYIPLNDHDNSSN